MPRQQPLNISRIIYPSVLIFFLFIIFLPAVYILKYFTSFGIFFNTAVINAIISSFIVGIIVTILNLIFGIPLAWVLTRSKNKLVKWIDNLIDLSLVMPTAALGFSIYLYWGTNAGLGNLLGLQNGVIGKGAVMIILLHIVFTLPYMIRSVAAAISQLEIQNEEASAVLGASSFTFFRTIALPLFREGAINGSILSFTRSLSETGATMMVAGLFATAPVLIIDLKNHGELHAAAGVSIILILTAISILLFAKLFLGQKKINLTPVYPKFEKTLSGAASLKNFIIFSFFLIFIFLPTIQIILYSMTVIRVPEDISLLSESLIFSLFLAFLATIINFIFSIPLSYLIARNKFGIGNIIDTLSEIVLLVPTGALGLSLALFWRQFISSDIIILLLAHMSFTFPLLIKPISSAIKDISDSQEEAAYSLGAGARKTFITILLPQIMPAIVAGCIMAFMRSLSETGATLAVTTNIKTITVLIVDQFNSGQLIEAAFTCTVLFLIAFIFLFFLKKIKYNTIRYN